MPIEPHNPGSGNSPDPLAPSTPVEIPQPTTPIGIPQPRPDTVPDPAEPAGIPGTTPQEDPGTMPQEEPQPAEPPPNPTDPTA